jgi:hypothetical protein
LDKAQPAAAHGGPDGGQVGDRIVVGDGKEVNADLSDLI